jgi:hypothetical protein
MEAWMIIILIIGAIIAIVFNVGNKRKSVNNNRQQFRNVPPQYLYQLPEEQAREEALRNAQRIKDQQEISRIVREVDTHDRNNNDMNSPVICNEIINLNKSIRFVGVVNNLGTLLDTSYREELIPLMTEEETKNYAMQAVLRAATREDFVKKLGRLKHSIGTYDRVIRATVPVIIKENLSTQTKFYLLLSFDIDANVKDIIKNELLPYIDKNLELFN